MTVAKTKDEDVLLKLNRTKVEVDTSDQNLREENLKHEDIVDELTQARNEHLLMQDALRDLNEMDQILDEWRAEQEEQLRKTEEGELGALTKKIGYL